MRTQLSIVVVAAGIVGTITAGTVSANVLMNQDTATMTAAQAPRSASLSAPAEVVRAPAAAPARKAAATRKATALQGTSSSSAITKGTSTKAATRKAAITYVVKRGDDLSSIAQWFALHGYADLFRANRAVIGSNPDLIFPGQRITIAGGTMTVR